MSPLRPPSRPEPTLDLDGLYRRDAGWLHAQLRRRYGARLSHLLEDLVQDAFMRVALSDPNAPIRHPRALVLKIACRLAIDALRRQGRRGALFDPLATPEAHDLGPAEPAAQPDALLLKQIVLGLPPKLRDAFLLVRIEGLSYADAAKRCGVSVKTLEWRMSQALLRCALAFREEPPPSR